jgi:hypothetical protein
VDARGVVFRVNEQGVVVDEYGVDLPMQADGRLVGPEGEALSYGADGKPLEPVTARPCDLGMGIWETDEQRRTGTHARTRWERVEGE